MKKIQVLIVSLFLPLIASGEILDKESSFSAEQDAETEVWTLECSSEVIGIDRLQAHNVGASLTGAGGSIFWTQIDILPNQHRITESAEGVYDFEVKKVGNKIKVSIIATWPDGHTGDNFTCVINIHKGLTPSTAEDTLYLMEIRHTIRWDGAPAP